MFENKSSQKQEQRKSLFELGQTLITPGAQQEVTQDDLLKALDRHIHGDWGDLDPEDKTENDLSVKNGYRILSAYHTARDTKFWVITEADRSSTTILLPDEY